MAHPVDRLFVYGTLRKGQPLHHHLQRAGLELVGRGAILGRLYDLGEYPGAVASDRSNEEIQGEVYRITDPDQLRELDEVEEYDPEQPDRSLFVRCIAEVHMASGQTSRAWVYFLPREPAGAERIREGDYSRPRRRPGDR